MAGRIPRPLGSTPRPPARGARKETQGIENPSQGARHMSDLIPSAPSAASRKFFIERTFRASVEELWELWTTKEGFESWWPPEGFRTEVHTIEARPNGKLRYEMVAETPEMVAVMKELGLP